MNQRYQHGGEAELWLSWLDDKETCTCTRAKAVQLPSKNLLPPDNCTNCLTMVICLLFLLSLINMYSADMFHVDTYLHVGIKSVFTTRNWISCVRNNSGCQHEVAPSTTNRLVTGSVKTSSIGSWWRDGFSSWVEKFVSFGQGFLHKPKIQSHLSAKHNEA